MADELENRIMQTFAPPKRGAVSREEEEAVKGIRPPNERGGRLPKFYRSEANEIRSSFAPNSVLAEQYGVSVETIKRVREVGRYADVPYIARDEVDRRSTSKGNVSQPKRKRANVRENRGRPYKSGRSQLLSHERKAIANSILTLKETAEMYGVSVSMVKLLRREYGTTMNRTGPLTHRLVRDIHKDARPVDEVAKDNHLPVQIVRAIREGTFSQRLLKDS